MLFIVKTIATQYDGRVYVQSERGQGNTFHVTVLVEQPKFGRRDGTATYAWLALVQIHEFPWLIRCLETAGR